MTGTTAPVESVARAHRGWWALRRIDADPVRHRRAAVAAWAVLRPAPHGRTEVVGLVPAGSHLALAADGSFYVYEAGFSTCECSAPLWEAADPRWCDRCAGVLAERPEEG